MGGPLACCRGRAFGCDLPISRMKNKHELGTEGGTKMGRSLHRKADEIGIKVL